MHILFVAMEEYDSILTLQNWVINKNKLDGTGS